VRRPGGLAIDGRDTLHVADADAHRIQMFDFGGRFLGTWGGPGAGAGEFDRPKQITIGREGNILVADEGNSRIQVFDRDRRFVRAIGRYGVGEGEMANPTRGTTGCRSSPPTGGSSSSGTGPGPRGTT